MNNHCVVDIETTSKKVNGRTATPFDDINYIVAWSVKDHSGNQTTRYCIEEEDREELIDLLIQYNVIVAHNAKFEFLYFYKYEKFQKWLKSGGKVYCTQLAEYYITNYKTQWASLRDIAVNKYKCKDRVKHLDRLLFLRKETLQQLKVEFEVELDPSKKWAIREEIKAIEGYNCVSDLPRASVLYDVDNDVKDTFIVYNEQQKQITKRGNTFRTLLENQMECLLSTTEMEYNGVLIDEKVAQEDKKELEEELKTLEDELNIIVKKYWKVYD